MFDTLFGTPVPSPPPEIPELKVRRGKKAKWTARQQLEKHREHETCWTCHQLIDPIGFGLENFDFLGRWREKIDGKPIDATGRLPSGETFDGPVELKRVLLGRREDFARQLVRKVLGYALGRGLDDRDSCTIASVTKELAKSGFRGRSFIQSIVLSTPFRNQQR